MNKFKESKKTKDQQKPRKTLGQLLVNSLELDLVNKKDLGKWLPFVLFLTVLALAYIANRIRTEEQVSDLNELQEELQDIKADYHTLKAEVAEKTKRSVVTKKAKKLGLVIPEEQPKVIALDE